MRIIIANDHAAVKLKLSLMSWMQAQGHEVVDLGVAKDQKADYPDKAVEAVELYRKGEFHFGVLCCGTGIGISIMANKMAGIRCALPQSIFAAKGAREHNDCQFIAFGERINYPETPTAMLDTFLRSEFTKGRHQKRVDKIIALEK